MIFLKKHWPHLLIVASLSDFLIPYLLGLFLPNFSHISDLISALGADTSPVRHINDGWSIINGLIFFFAGIGIIGCHANYALIEQKLLGLCVVIFGLGDCLISGIFSNTGAAWSVFIHDAGSGLGFVALTIAPLLMVPFVKISRQKIYYGFFMVGIVATLLFALPKVITFYHISFRGLLQRIDLICLYAPLVVFALLHPTAFIDTKKPDAALVA